MEQSHRRTIRFTLNGRPATADIATHETVVDVLRRDFGLFGARESCGQGLCGCCTTLVDGLAVSGCLYLAAFIDGTAVATVEGLAKENELHPIQQSFVENCAFQCGFCTPGFVLMTKELLERHPQPSTEDIRHYLSGNLCRCATYPDIIRAVKAAADR
jgi:aerobic-type carbon monoxide dehydrogenase small subunit (CoxS/CutS family)